MPSATDLIPTPSRQPVDESGVGSDIQSICAAASPQTSAETMKEQTIVQQTSL